MSLHKNRFEILDAPDSKYYGAPLFRENCDAQKALRVRNLMLDEMGMLPSKRAKYVQAVINTGNGS